MLPQCESLAETLSRKDKSRLQGAWRFLNGTRTAQLLVEEDRFTIEFRNGDTYHGRFVVDPAHRPKAIDLHIEDGPERHKGKLALGLYLLDGSRLLLAPGIPGSGDRPPALPAQGEAGQLLLVFERQKAVDAGA